MRKPRPDPEVVAALRAWLKDAESGDVRDVFIVARMADGTVAEQCLADDADDMLFEVRSACIRLSNELAREPH